MVILYLGRVADEFVPLVHQIPVRPFDPLVIGCSLQRRKCFMHFRNILFGNIV
ncbi:hypothetical protein D3C86_2215500 [compost metagenome]